MAAHRRRLDVLLTELPDGSGSVVHLEHRCFYPLSRSGVLLWRLYDGGAFVDDEVLVTALVDRYRIAAETARRDVGAFVARLVSEGILVAA
jgi:hypothetical protein